MTDLAPVRVPIGRIELTVLSLPLVPPFRAAVRRFDAVVTIIAEVSGANGLTGIGTGFAFSREDARVIVAAVDMLRPLILGADASRPEALWTLMADATVFLGRSGASMSAIGILDMALWDLAARAAGLPLWRMLGGARDRIVAYGSGGSLALTTAQLVAEMEGFAAQGYTAIKLKLGSTSEGGDPARLAALRRALGDEIRIAVDGNQQWSVKAAIAAARRIAEFDLWWLEEPLPADWIEALAEVRRAVPMPVATGETNGSPADFASILSSGAADMVMPNLQRVGGITPWRKVAAAAQLLGIPILSHVQPEVQVHLMCAAPNALALEHVPWWPWPFAEPLKIEAGMAEPPDAPGLGVNLDPDFLKRHRID